MNRENLFRGRQLDRTWVEGYLFSTKEHTYIAYRNQFDDDLFLSPKEIFIEVDPETVCRYTGMPDKNGRKIFEGDIVKEDWGSFKAVIRFGEFESQVLKNIGFNLEWFGGVGYRQDLPYWTDKVEVIGNIFDNPELLEGESNGRA